MGFRSNVFVGVENGKVSEFKKLEGFTTCEFEEIKNDDDLTIFKAEDVKWYANSYDDVIGVQNFVLDANETDDVLNFIVAIGEDGGLDHEASFGEWWSYVNHVSLLELY